MKQMPIPDRFKVGRKSYYVQHGAALPYKIRGRINPLARKIELAFLGEQEQIAATFWHEVTHAILHDMDAHVKWTNEPFVKEFSKRLAQVVRTASFNG